MPFILPESFAEVAIVEDDDDTAEMLAEMVRLSGYEVRLYHGAQTAMAAFRKHAPDLVMLDIMMPDISGLEVLRHLRRDPALHSIPVIILSAKGTPQEVKEGLEAGANMYLTKPVQFGEVKAALQKFLPGAPAE